MITIGEQARVEAEDLKPEDFALWRHHPVSKVFLRFMVDQAGNWRDAAMSLWEGGHLTKHPERPDLDSDFIRGQVVALLMAEKITLPEIQAFYAEAREDTEEAPPPPPEEDDA